MPAGVRYAGTAGPAGELWFVLDGGGELRAGETAASVAERHGVLLPPECPFELTAGEGGLRLDIAAPPAGTPVTAGGVRVTGLADCPAEITGDRRFRVLFGPDNGCAAVTQFAGEIPPGRAAPHRHEYDEVVLILAGTGVLHAGEQAGGTAGTRWRRAAARTCRRAWRTAWRTPAARPWRCSGCSIPAAAPPPRNSASRRTLDRPGFCQVRRQGDRDTQAMWLGERGGGRCHRGRRRSP